MDDRKRKMDNPEGGEGKIGDMRYKILDIARLGFRRRRDKLEFGGFAELTIDN